MNGNIVKDELVKKSPSKRQISIQKYQNNTTKQKQNKNTDTSQSFQSWDSGVARDLSPPRGYNTGMESHQDKNTMLDLASQFHVATLSALNNEAIELRSKLKRAELEKEALRHQLHEAFEERERSQRRLDALGAAHESRITEMHCVIVELNKKLKAQQDSAILEEPEGSVSELSFQEGSIYNSDLDANNDADDQNEFLEDHIAGVSTKSTSPCSLPPPAASTSAANAQVQALQEEVLHLRAQIALLQSQLASHLLTNPTNEEQNPTIPVNEIDEKSNYTSDDLCETADIFDVEQNEGRPDMTQSCQMKQASKKQSNIDVIKCSTNFTAEPPISKVAERVKLRRTIEEKHITGTDILQTGIYSTEIAEHLVSNMLQEPLDEHEKITRLRNEIQRLKVQNSVVTLTLAESKEHCEQLYLLCGKYESNAIALQQALNCSDRAIEAYDVMLALLESKLSLLEKAPTCEESRKAAETVARHLLNRLNDDTAGIMSENSAGPWQQPVVLKPTDDMKPWTEEDDISLRKHVSKLKGQRFTAQNTVVTLESPFSYGKNRKEDLLSPTSTSRGRSRNENRRIDLETAVLLQELNDYKTRTEIAERDKLISQKQLMSLQEALLHLQGQLADSEALLAMATKDRSSFSEAEYAVNIERELVEALAREARLKERLQGLAGSLEAAAKSTANMDKFGQIQQSHITELRQTNIGLDKSLERCKKRYQAKMNKLQQQLLQLSLTNNNNPNNVSQKDEQPIAKVDIQTAPQAIIKGIGS